MHADWYSRFSRRQDLCYKIRGYSHSPFGDQQFAGIFSGDRLCATGFVRRLLNDQR